MFVTQKYFQPKFICKKNRNYTSLCLIFPRYQGYNTTIQNWLSISAVPYTDLRKNRKVENFLYSAIRVCVCVCGGGVGGLRSQSFTCKPSKQAIDQSIDLCVGHEWKKKTSYATTVKH